MEKVIPLIGPVSLILVVYIIIGVVLYYLYIMRKLNKKKEAYVKVHETLKVGSNVILLNGIYGKVVRIYDEYCDVELNPNNVIKVSRFAISAFSK